MKTLNLIQGSQEWLAARRSHFTASDAPAVMGASPYKSRDQLLHEKATGENPEISDFQQALFDKGHAAEKAALPILEDQKNLEFYPVCGVNETDGLPLMASFDGLTMCESFIFEHKLWNAKKAELIADEGLQPEHYWQLEHQLIVSSADLVYFVMSDSDENGANNFTVTTYQSQPERRSALIAAWQQFKIDLDNYKAPEAVEVIEKKVIETLPTLAIKIDGSVKSSNLAVYKSTALEFINNINTDLKNDNDFAEAEAVVKFCSKAEKELDSVKAAALNQTADISDLFKTIDDLKEAMRQKRLFLNKEVESRKKEIKREICENAFMQICEHVQGLQQKVGFKLPFQKPDFNSAIKNKRTLTSIQSAANDHLAELKIAANLLLDKCSPNIEKYNAIKNDYGFLFPDVESIIDQPHESFCAVIDYRIMEAQRKEKERQEAEAIRLESLEKQKEELREIPREETPILSENKALNDDRLILEAARNVINTALKELQALQNSCTLTQTEIILNQACKHLTDAGREI